VKLCACDRHGTDPLAPRRSRRHRARQRSHADAQGPQAGPARRATLATTDGYGIYAGTQHPDAAWELVKFLVSKDYGRAMARANFLQPARASLVEEWVSFIQAEFPAQAEEIDIAAFADGHVKGYSVTAEIFANMTGVRAIIDAAFEEILTLGQASVAERMKAVCDEITRIQSS